MPWGSFLFQLCAVVEDGGVVKEQHILVFKLDKSLQHPAFHKPDVYQGHGFIICQQQGSERTCKGVPEDHQFSFGFCIGIFDPQQRLGAGQIDLLRDPVKMRQLPEK